MSSTLVSYKENAFWLHNATGEVLLGFILRKIQDKAPSSGKVKELEEVAEMSLKHCWVTGFLHSLGVNYISDPSCRELIIACVSEAIDCAQASKDDIVYINSYSANRKMFLEETYFLKELIEGARKFPRPPVIFSLEKGEWITA